jgi:hypothetical protein
MVKFFLIRVYLSLSAVRVFTVQGFRAWRQFVRGRRILFFDCRSFHGAPGSHIAPPKYLKKVENVTICDGLSRHM